MIVWMLAGTLGAAMARQALGQRDTSGLLGFQEAWDDFRLSLREAEVPEDFLIQVDLMESRGELPPGWAIHPKLGLFHLYNAVVHVITDDTPEDVVRSLLDPDPEEGPQQTQWTPVQIFVHAHPQREVGFEDTLYFAMVKRNFDRGVSNRRRGYTHRRGVQMDLRPEFVQAFEAGFYDLEKSAEDFYRKFLAEAAAPYGDLAWDLFVEDADVPPIDTDTVDLLVSCGIFHLAGRRISPTHILMDQLPSTDQSYRALKNGFVVARMQHHAGSPYAMNWVIHPTPPWPSPFLEDWMVDTGKDAAASRWIQRLPRRSP